MQLSTKSACKIALFGNVGINNLGNECTLDALIYNIRKHIPQAEMFVICTNPDDTASRHNLPTVQMESKPLFRSASSGKRGLATRVFRLLFDRLPAELRGFVAAWRQLKDADMLLMAGTGMLTDDGEAPLGLPFQILKWSFAARLRGTSVRFVAAGVGPLSTRLARCFVRTALWRADYRSYRDLQSHQRLIEAGFHHYQDRVVPDLAFSFPRERLPRLRSTTRSIVGVGLIDHLPRGTPTANDALQFETYFTTMVDFVADLIDRGLSVRLLYGDSLGDYAVGQRLADQLAQRSSGYSSDRIDSEPLDSVDDLLLALVGTSLVTSPRFHNLVLAVMIGKPIIPISYDAKTEAIAETFDAARYCQPIWDLDRDKLLTDCIQALEENEKHASRLVDTAEELRKQWDVEYPSVLAL